MTAPLKCPTCKRLLRRKVGEEDAAFLLLGQEITVHLTDAPVWVCASCSYQLCDEECMQRRQRSFQEGLDQWWWERLRQAGGSPAEILKLRQLFVRVVKNLGTEQAAQELGAWLGRPLPENETANQEGETACSSAS